MQGECGVEGLHHLWWIHMDKRTNPSQFPAIGIVVFNVVIVDFSRVAHSEGEGNVVLRVYIVLGSFAWRKEQTPHGFKSDVFKLMT